MSVDIDAIKRKLLIKYPTFGSVIANLEFQASKDIATAGTDGKVLLYNPKFVSGLSDKERTFLFAHEVCHVAFEHIFRSEGKDKQLWNIATDSVINALLKQDGLPMIEGGVDIPEAVKYDEEWTRKNARMRNGYFRHKVEEIPIPETEILLDTSGSVSETLLRNFLRECKNILANSKVKVGCFNTEFHGFTELRRVEDIDNMSFPIGGGTDFNAAVEAFSRRVPNKIIFTDGEAPMPEKAVRNVIWVVFGNQQINPRGGKVININGEQLRKLYRYMQEDKSSNISR